MKLDDMTLWDWYAGAALIGLYNNKQLAASSEDAKNLAWLAAYQATQMLRERQRWDILLKDKGLK